MAENIYIRYDYGAIAQRIESLLPTNKRNYGVMNLPQMLQHCSIQLKMALGLLPTPEPEGSFLYRTAIGRFLSLYVIPWPRNFGTPEIMNMLTNGLPVQDFDSEKAELLYLMKLIWNKEFLSPHHFYGVLNRKDWGRLIWVHLDYHLRQFNG